VRFFIGGLAVSLFAVLADVIRPKSFAGLFGAAPSIALATLVLTVSERGASFAAAEGRSMMVGGVALASCSGEDGSAQSYEVAHWPIAANHNVRFKGSCWG